ncbi:MAG: YggS family pyridoxal phosphate-dependent enzyme [Firmicutes bacterium]|nr:YggS family pyridoxal phosphate-dependent enzyme [Bacillota bacterium]
MNISDNIKKINEKIDIAAQKSGRTRKDILLVGVTKTIDSHKIEQAALCGINDFGENKAQEFVRKQPDFPEASWHFIGHLQTNKAKYVVEKAHLIHSVDSLRLAKEVSRLAKKKDITCKVLIQLNISAESTKFGIPPKELIPLLESVQTLDNIKVCGLMTIAPINAKKEETKYLYEKCNNLFVDIKGKKYHNVCMEILSMGMTNDFETAILCGANIVRIGSGIFGKRNYDIK